MQFPTIVALRLLLVLSALSVPAPASSPPTEGFIFPRVSEPPDVFNLTASLNDSMIVEYTKLTYTTAVGINMDCHDSLEDARGNATYGNDYDNLFGPYTNTGKVYWNFTLAQDSVNENLTFCRFLLFNDTLDSCNWGPWGLGSEVYAANYTVPLFYSPIFRVVADGGDGGDEPVVWTNTQDKTMSASPPEVTATATVNVTCPPSGIPPLPTPVVVKQQDVWPPMAENLSFPEWVEQY